ncbi:MAG: class A beta-lactamase-related serine hydrolase [Pseudomonadota bacterium]|nr:class A beta-lactamase-related serine hydrolase [Pseudomonadota bacterium]
MSHGNAALADGLLRAALAQDFGAELPPFPSIDLAVAAFKPSGSTRFANVLFSREHRHGVVAVIDDQAGAVGNLRFDRDQRNAAGESVAWLAESDWSTLQWTKLWGDGPQRFVAPYPASLLKLLVAVGVGIGIDRGLVAGWPDAVEPMITVSDNEATDAMVALLHRHRLIEALNARLQTLGLHTLQLNSTTAAGGWRNADGAGVGQIHMTAWDTVRLLWLLDAEAPPAPWLPPRTTLLQPATRDHLRTLLQRQQLDEILSSGAARHLPGWVLGAPDAPAFAHKTGLTDHYASDAGIVSVPGIDVHYIVAVLTSLGRRHAPDPRVATTWRVPKLGAAIHALMSGSTATLPSR